MYVLLSGKYVCHLLEKERAFFGLSVHLSSGCVHLSCWCVSFTGESAHLCGWYVHILAVCACNSLPCAHHSRELAYAVVASSAVAGGCTGSTSRAASMRGKHSLQKPMTFLPASSMGTVP